MSSEWFVLRGGREYDPFTVQQLHDHVAQGHLHPDDLVRRADLPAPQRAGDIEGLFVRQQHGHPPPIGTRFPPNANGFRPADYGSFMPSDGFFAGIKRLVLALFGKKAVVSR